MGNRSRAIAHLVGVRNAGRKDEQGRTFGGLYIPGYTNAQGKPVSARWIGNFFMNGAGYTDGQGVQQEGRRDVLSLTAWNGKNSNEGSGMADLFAKIMSPGLEISVDVEPVTYEATVYNNGQPVTAPDGTILTTRKVGFKVIPGTLIIGQESAKFVESMVAAGLRAAGWNNPSSPEYNQFRENMKQWHAQAFVPGSKTFGYALVGQPKGAQTNVYGGGNAGWGGQPNAWATGGAPSGWGAPAGTSEPMVEGKTYDQWVAGGVSPQAMLNSSHFAPFHEKAKAASGGAQAFGWASPAAAATAGGDIPY